MKYLNAEKLREIYRGACKRIINMDGKNLYAMTADEFDALVYELVGTDMIPRDVYETEIRKANREIERTKTEKRDAFMVGLVAGIFVVIAIIAIWEWMV